MHTVDWPATTIAAHAEQARTYLASELGTRAPTVLQFAAAFEEQPLEGEGSVALFRFDLPPDGGTCAKEHTGHYVVVGCTEPNYFPAYEQDSEGAYDFHIGTRYALGVGLARVASEREPATARRALQHLVSTCNPGIVIEREELAGLFDTGAQLFAVYRLRLAGQEVYCLGADCPPGFYSLTKYPPQVVLRLHLGRLIRNEARDEAEHAAARRLSRARGGD
ncbi:MAG: hypothetical protein IPM18_06035 [Phycisphaerales bacterium]|nr:hypothetical protein [Phycisphaerales bacterium]